MGPLSTVERQERLFRLLLRAAAFAHYDYESNADPASLLYEGVVSPRDLDGKALPPLP